MFILYSLRSFCNVLSVGILGKRMHAETSLFVLTSQRRNPGQILELVASDETREELEN